MLRLPLPLWIFDQEFTITGAQEAAINKKEVTVPNPDYSCAWWLLVLLLLLLLRRYKEDAYDIEGANLHDKGDRIKLRERRRKTYFYFDDLSKASQECITDERNAMQENIVEE